MTTQATYFNNAEGEVSLLGAILQHNEVLDRHKITRDLFYEESHRIIFDEVLRIRARGSIADLPSVAQALPAYSVQIASCTDYLVADIKGLIQRLRDCVQARGVHQAIETISEMQNDLRPAGEVVEEATKRIIQLTETRDVSYRSLMEVASDSIKEIEARMKCPTEYSGVESGIEPLDLMTDGFQDGDYIILGARPSVGKTALALTMAFNAAKKKETVGFMSLETKDTALFKRVLAAQSGLSMQAIRTGLIGPRGMNDLISGCSKIANTKVFFADVPNMHINDLIAEARILRSREKITFLVIDYIGLITADQGQAPRWETFSMISQRLKSLARELKIPVLALSQLSRASDGKRPTLADLRETGSLEQDADLVMFIHREENSNDQKQPVTLIVAKQRNGSTGDIHLLFDKERMQFSTDTSGGPDKEPRQPYKD